jgi:hypothetical protein
LNITKSDVVKLIEEKKIDSFQSHLLNILKRDFTAFGEIRESEIRVWSQNPWNAFFYPVFTFELNSKNELINIKDKLNAVGKIVYGLFILLVSIPWVPQDFPNIDFSNYIIPFVVYILFLGVLVLVSLRVYKMEKRIQLEQIYEILDIETEKRTEKEWSWTKIATRLIMYPLSIFLIIVNILFVIPKGQFILTIASLGLVGVYLYTDLRILMRKKTTGNKG